VKVDADRGASCMAGSISEFLMKRWSESYK